MKAASCVATTADWLRARTRALLRNLHGAARGEPEPVHHLRVNARRLRAALPFLARRSHGRRVRRLRRALTALLRAAGCARDCDVRLVLLEQLGEPVSDGLRRRLRAAQRRARRRMSEALREVDVARLRRRLARLQARARPDAAAVRAGAARAVLDASAELARSLHAPSRRFDAEALHALRSVCRRLRYTAELRDALAERASGAPAALQPLQDALGEIHDLHVLAVWLARSAARVSGAERSSALRLRRRALLLARRRHRAWLALEPRRVVLDAFGQVEED